MQKVILSLVVVGTYWFGYATGQQSIEYVVGAVEAAPNSKWATEVIASPDRSMHTAVFKEDGKVVMSVSMYKLRGGARCSGEQECGAPIFLGDKR